MDLRRKGLSGEIISKTMDSLQDYDEKQAAKDLVFSRFHKMTGISAEKKKTRLFGFLKRRGFNSNTILAVLSELFKEMEQE